VASAWLAERETGEPVYSLSDTLMGCLSGLVSITAGCAYVQSWASIIIGFVAGILYLAGSRLMIRFGIDDAVDAVCDSHDTHSLYETRILSNQCFIVVIFVVYCHCFVSFFVALVVIFIFYFFYITFSLYCYYLCYL
jgi:hypothetical protein